MSDIQINPRFETLLRFLTDEEFNALEQSCLADGIREPVRIWREGSNEWLVDGHHRFKISQKHGLDFAVRQEFFNNEDEVCLWIINNQLGRRNLSDSDRQLYIGMSYHLQKRLSGGQEGNQNWTGSGDEGDTVSESSTAAKIASEMGVSERTVYRAAKVAEAFEAAPQEIKDAYKREEMTQTELVSQLKSVKEPPKARIGDGKHDGFTEGAKELANRLQLAITKVHQVANDLDILFTDNNLNLRYFAPEISSLHAKLQQEQEEALLLKTLERCPAPTQGRHENCVLCGESGYIPKNEVV